MNVFEVHGRIIDDYARYIRSFIRIDDDEIHQTVHGELAAGKLWPDHEEHEITMEWIGGEFDPEKFSTKARTRAMRERLVG
jgi:hypothetical protein